ncbi:hypothetical protein CHARACLAT_027127 [Characodon lateralis]|uniref:Uncharacterized protein n=1 Tax=Characodon lateralis TaxID=208331 RepID=A0ABU7F9J7_9TELE|nr:hypothetical protein [Characodon lateralis]
MQAGQQSTSHTNTEAANKKHPTQNGRPAQMQVLGQHSACTPHSQTNRDPQGQSSRPRDPPSRPPPCPMERCPASRRAHRAAAACKAKRPHYPLRCRTTAILASQAKTADARATPHILPYVGSFSLSKTGGQ